MGIIGIAAASEQVTVWDQLVMGGVTELILILMSVAGLALIIEHFITIRHEKLAPPYLLRELESLLDGEEWDEALDLCEAEDCVLARTVSAGISRREEGRTHAEGAVSEALDAETTALFRKISGLAMIAAVAPMLGLLGTVLGMMAAFTELSRGPVDASDLAGGISQALITTATGLILAIPVMVCYGFFRSRVMRAVQEVGVFANTLMSR